MAEYLVALHVFLLFAIYRLFNRDLSSPSFLFISGFTIASYVAYCYRQEWDLGLHANTFYLIVSGSITFFIIEYVYRKKHTISQSNVIINKNAFLFSSYKLIAFAVFQMIIYYLHYKQQVSFANTSVLADAISEIDQDNKFGDKSFTLPWYINVPHAFCQVSGYVWICLFVYYLKLPKKYNRNKLLIGINMLLSMGGSLLSGGRMPLFGYLISLGVMFFTLNNRRRSVKGRSLKQQLFIIFIGLLFIFSFSQIGTIIGRHETDTLESKYVLAVYCGAQIKNLDIYVNSKEPASLNEYLLCPNSFLSFYDFLRTRLGVNIPIKKQSYEFIYNKGYFLGNVYTCYRIFYNDAKEFSFLLVGFSSLLGCILYRRFKRSSFFQTGRIDLNVFLYSFFCMGFFLSFFSELFLKRLLSVEYFIRSAIYFYIIIYILYDKRKNFIFSIYK